MGKREREEEAAGAAAVVICEDDGGGDDEILFDNVEEEEEDGYNEFQYPLGREGEYYTSSSSVEEEEDMKVVEEQVVENDDGGDERLLLLYNNNNKEEEEEEEEEGFAAEFYRSGTDCSSLLSSSSSSLLGPEREVGRGSNPNNNNNNNNNTQKLKQSNLFQIWGLQNNNNINNNNNKKAKQANLLQMWGLSNNNNYNNPPVVVPSPSSSCSIGKTETSTSRRRRRSSKNDGGGGVMTKQPPIPPPPRSSSCPFYKKIPGTPFTVDAFRFGAIQGCRGYILTHFHADHYGGLTKSWSHGPIFSTPLTARLLTISLYVHPQYIHPLELDTEYVIEGITVTLLEANHCPGAALIHLRLPSGQCVLHTGDFRASKTMQQYPLLSEQRVNVVYLDTTYCNHKYRFPAKEDVLRFVVKVVENCLRNQPKTLIVVGAYSIGKECVYIAISKALGVKIHADSRRRRILQSFGWSELSSNLTSDGKETPLHVLPISSLKFEVMESYLKTFANRYTAILAFRPTGWTYSESIGSHLDLIKPLSKGRVTIYGVPYSEHSSFLELEEFIKFLRPDKIIPTVNIGNAAHRNKMQSYFRAWLK